jgi:hypothetical protein
LPRDEELIGGKLWLHRYLTHYNRQAHRSEPHSRLEDWLQHLPETGIRAMCSWERFCAFAREPERCRIGADAHLTVEGVTYEVDPDLAGESVVLWWGLFDQDLYVEHADRRYGPYRPWGGPIPLHRYRSFKKTKTESGPTASRRWRNVRACHGPRWPAPKRRARRLVRPACPNLARLSTRTPIES